MSGLITAAMIGVGGSYLINRANQSSMNSAADRAGEANLQTSREQSMMNNPNVSTPYGTSTYTESATPGGRPTLTQTLSPAEQAAYEARNGLRSGYLSALSGAVPGMANTLKGPFGLPGDYMQGLDPRFAPLAGDIQKDANLGQAGPIQSGLNFRGAPAMPVASDATRQAVADAVYRQGSRYLDPLFAQQHYSLNTMLANQGITRGSSAQDREQGNLDRTKMMAYGDLGDRATQQGMAAMQQLYAMQMAARQQGVGEISSQGQFANAAQQQAVQELLASMGARNSAATTGANIANLSTTAANNARGLSYKDYMNNLTMPFTLSASLQNGTQVNNPQFQPLSPTSITPPPIMEGAKISAANMSANNQLLGGVLNAGANWYGNKGSTAPSLFASQTAAPITDFSQPLGT